MMVFQKNLFLFLAPIIGSSTFLTTPVFAANISISNLSLEINNFNQQAAGVADISDIDIINIAEEGIVESTLTGNTMFTSMGNEVFARAAFQNRTVGSGSSFIGRANILSSLVGSFFVNANQDFKFDIKFGLDLINSSDRFQANPLSSGGIISLSLFDSLTQKTIPVLNLSSLLNTDTLLSSDIFNFRVGINTLTTNRYEQISLGEDIEFIQVLFNGTFQWRPSQDTLLTLVATTQSCSYTSNINKACFQVPEPSLRLSTLLSLLCIGMIARMIQQIIQLTCQPFTKHILKKFLIKLRR